MGYDHDIVRGGPEAASDRAGIHPPLDRTDAFEALFLRHHATVHAYLARRSGRDAADDLAGEVFCRAFRARDRFDDRSPDAIGWLIGIARNLLHERRRSREREHRNLRRAVLDPTIAHAAIDGPGVAADVPEQVDRRDELARVRTALGQIPDALVEPLLLLAWERLSYGEIAAALDIPVGTVRSRIARSRSRLAELLALSGQEGSEPLHEREVMR